MKGMGNTVRWPQKPNNPNPKRDTTKWCDFDVDHGDSTPNCIALCLEVTDHLKNGHLQDLLSEKGRNTLAIHDNRQVDHLVEPTPERIMNVIMSGITYSTARRYARLYYGNQMFMVYCCVACEVLYISLFLFSKNLTENLVDVLLGYAKQSIPLSILISLSLFGWAVKQAINVIQGIDQFQKALEISPHCIFANYGLASGLDNMKLMDDMVALRPTIFCSVPRLYNRIHAGIINAVKTSNVLKEWLFNAAYNAKKKAILNGKNPSPMWDRLVFNKIKEKLGGRVHFMVSGASPLSLDVMDFWKICFGGRVAEGYGMTETTCVISSMDEGNNLSGHVGSPNPTCEIKLVYVPKMNYTIEDQPYPRGEICVRGPIIFRSYHKAETQTREVIDEDGWLHTGDIGLWLLCGRLKIIEK